MENKRLKNLFKLSSRLTVYVPATNNANEIIDNKPYVDTCAALLSDCFGGATSSPALGYWLSASKGLIRENTTIVFAYASEADLQTKLDRVIDYCERLKTELSQESIALELNGEMYFI